jgi:formylglycine-generating enzyme required for sulfatase activity
LRSCDDGDECTTDACDEGGRQCSHEPVPGCGCEPDCTGRSCGPDPLCGESCGDCAADETCLTGDCVVGIWLHIDAAEQSFTMGSPEGEPGRYSDEVQHLVTFTRDFVILSTEVTQEMYLQVMGYNPSHYQACGGDCPVEMVHWHEAAAFCNALSEAVGVAPCYACTGTSPDFSCGLDPVWTSPYVCPGFRLPTEAEWEYAARAGTDGSTYNGTFDADHRTCEQPNDVLDSIAWFCGNSSDLTHRVMTRDPNPWGLYDVLGNVWEWVHDWQADYQGDETDPWGPPDGAYRICRGGSYDFDARRARSASRSYDVDTEIRVDRLGLRPVRSID